MKLALLLVLASSAYAEPRPSVDAITWKIFDRAKGTVVAVDKGSDPYGMNMDLLVIVKMHGPEKVGGSLTLESTTKASSSEATGDAGATMNVQTQQIDGMPEGGVGYQLFVVPYQCAENMSFRATLKVGTATVTKTAKHSFFCAE